MSSLRWASALPLPLALSLSLTLTLTLTLSLTLTLTLSLTLTLTLTRSLPLPLTRRVPGRPGRILRGQGPGEGHPHLPCISLYLHISPLYLP